MLRNYQSTYHLQLTFTKERPNLFGFDEARSSHQEVYGSGGYENQAKFSHELITSAAAFEGMKKWEDHQRNEGQPVSHEFAKELLAGFVGGEVDKLAETKGMDFYDKEKAQHQAKKGAEQMYDDQYGGDDRYEPERSERPNFEYQKGSTVIGDEEGKCR